MASGILPMSTLSRVPGQIECIILIHENGKLECLPSTNSLRISLVGRGIRLSFPRNSDPSIFTWYSPDVQLTHSNNYHIAIEMPAGGFVQEQRDLTQDEKETLDAGLLRDGVSSEFRLLNIKILEGFNTTIVGFGLPFHGATQETHSWVNKGTSIYSVATLAEILQRRDFTLLVKATSDQLKNAVRNVQARHELGDYGYGEHHTWDPERYETQIPSNRGPAFMPTIRFKDANQRDTALTQIHVQDKGKHMRAVTRFLRGDHNKIEVQFEGRRSTGHNTVTWEAKHLTYGATNYLQDVDVTDRIPFGLIRPRKGQPGHRFSPIHHNKYPGVENDIKRDSVRLQLQRNLEGEKKRVDAVNRLGKYPWPTLTKDEASEHRKQAIFDFLLVGQGLWNATHASLSVEFPPLDLFQSVLHQVQQACLELVFDDDRDRVRTYFSKLHFGFGFVSGPPGSGKSNLASVLTVLMCFNESIKHVYVSAGSNVATTNILNRMNDIATTITHKLTDRGYQSKRLMFIRGYSYHEEIKNCLDALAGVEFEEDAVWNPTPWRFKLSLCWWTLRALGATTVPPLTLDDNQELWELYQKLNTLAAPGPAPKDSVSRFEELVKTAHGQTTLATPTKRLRETLSQLMNLVLSCSNVVATTPAASNSKMYKSYNSNKAHAVVFDEAATMFLSDGLIVFGNMPRPMIAIGDPQQLGPVLPTEIEMLHDKRDRHEKYDLAAQEFPTNRFARFANISWLTHFIHLGWPVFHLYTQHRMVEGLFDMSINTVYRHMKPQFKYSPLCQLINFPIAIKVEEYMKRKYRVPSPATPGRLQPVFFDCHDCPCCNFPYKASRLNPRQVDCMAKLLIEMIQDLSLSTADIAVITPYVANCGAIRKRFFKDEALKNIECSTFDRFQGREAQVVLVSLCVDHVTGPSFVANPRKLNVALTRQRSSLLIFGDIEMNRMEFREKQDAESKDDGSSHFDRDLFRTVFRVIRDSGRIVKLYGDTKIDLKDYWRRLNSSSEYQ
ncbi:P-loop containing nucleoside triphosphate hydrolase protein [Fusarium tricinctum]|uniref:P-loop containing nucleoside triphosphate hydrolase protein n=1 Tax=Fusarium tricinctum TaxID=61284 RepID=A0A8K0WH99_9HYPO|nr:P-loop containing nucleoside triphosphate hydrolase protein [Fusarium tricinctum]